MCVILFCVWMLCVMLGVLNVDCGCGMMKIYYVSLIVFVVFVLVVVVMFEG